jgi:hypothetical protein
MTGPKLPVEAVVAMALLGREDFFHHFRVSFDQRKRVFVLEDGASFVEWAHPQWPAPRWSVELDPGQLNEVAGAHKPLSGPPQTRSA